MSAARTRDRDWSRIDAWLGLLSLVVFLVANKIDGQVSSIAFRFVIRLTLFAQPYFLLRVARHYRDIPDAAVRAAAIGAVTITAITVAVSAFGGGRMPVTAITGTVVVLSQLAGAALFLSIARAHRAMARFRFGVASIGAVCLALFFLVAALRPERPVPPDLLGIWQVRLFAGILVFGYIGLVPPQFLRRWARTGEEARFMRIVNDRSPDEQGARVAQDLAEAIARGVTASCVAVALGDELLEVRGANRPGWVGHSAVPGAGAGRALRERAAVIAPIDALEWEWRASARSSTRFLAVPIIGAPVEGASKPWGAVLVLQRHASLFPQDDLDLIDRLCRYAAGILDHAALLEADRLRRKRDADQRLGAILDSLTDYAVVTVDAAGTVVEASAGAETVFGTVPGGLVGTAAATLFTDGAPWLPQALAKARHGEAFMQDVPVRRGGASVTGSLVLRPVLERGMPSSRAVMVIRDVTHQRGLEMRLRQSEKMEAMGQMTAGIAHNFNNMALILQLHTDELATRFLDLGAMGHVRAISEAVERTTALAHQLLGFSKSDTDDVQVFSLADCVGAILPMVDTVTTRAVTVSTDIDPSSPEVKVSRSRLDQVIVNIAVNARDAIQGTGTLHVRVRGVQLGGAQAAALGLPAGRYGLLEMSDTGVGMDAETRARIFDPFFTTKQHGTGLGLATVQAAVTEMGGAIDVVSSPGRGTTFRIYIPEHVAVA